MTDIPPGGRGMFDPLPRGRELDVELGRAIVSASCPKLPLEIARALDAGRLRGAGDTSGFLDPVIR